MEWTKEQREAIEIRDKSILVSAAAGSGKTAVLVERIKQLILEEKIPLDQMLVVTFTNAAASEMREKIVSAIPEQINQIHKAHISTFHSFAIEVIKRYYHLINIEPGFKICDDTQRVILQSEAIQQLFQTGFKEEDKGFLHFLNLYANSKNEEAVKNIVMETHEFIQSLPNPFRWLEDKIEDLNCGVEDFKSSLAFKEILDEIEEELSTALTSCRKVFSLIDEYGLPKLLEKAKKDVEMILSVCDSFEEDYEKGVEAIKNIQFQRFAATKPEKEDFALISDDIKMIRDGVKENLKKISNLYCAKSLNEYVAEINETYQEMKTLLGLVKDFDSIYKGKKKKKGLIDFSDIEHYALEILTYDEAAKEYREKFRHIFIDEYQDSNLVQETIISKIQRDDNVFMVGDVKQSIYKFRLAEPEIFIDKYLKFKHEDSNLNIKIDLNRNFRSKGPIIEFVNDVFSQIMNKRMAGMDYDEDAALYNGVAYKGELEYPVEIHLVDDKRVDSSELDDEIKEMKRAELEAFTAANLIKASKGLPYYDVKSDEERVLQNKDIVILLRSSAGIGEIYYEALEKEGIPAYIDMGDGYFDTLEILVFLNLLKTIDNRKQDIELLSILRSPILSFSIKQLAEIRLENKKGDYYTAFYNYSKSGQDDKLKEKCDQALRLLENWKYDARLKPLPDFLWELLLETGYYNYVGALPGGTQRQANLRALVDKASAYESSQSKGLFGFINYIEAMKRGKVATAPVKTLGESDDVVRIMTVHKSKGLEFPMVLVGNLGRRFHRESGKQISMHKDIGIALKHVDRKNSCWRRTILQNVIDARKNREALAEEIRILYVSLTRPMDKLVLLGTVNDIDKVLRLASMRKELGVLKGNSFMDYLLPSLSESNKVITENHDRGRIGQLRREKQRNITQLKKALVSGFRVEKCLSKEIEKRFSWEYSFPKALSTKSKYSVSELSHNVEEELSISTIGRTKSVGANRGTVYHKIMEKIPFKSEGYSAYEIRNYIEGMVEREILTLEDIEMIDISKIEQFFKSKIGERACQSNEIFREVSFNQLIEKDKEEIIVQGTIDCYFKEKDKYILLDYKSNYVVDEDGSIEILVDRYRNQLELYKHALEKIRGIDVDEVYLYLFEIGKEARVYI